MFSSFIKNRNRKKIQLYTREMPIQLKMRNKELEQFSYSQVSEVLRVTQLGSGLPNKVKNEKFAYAMFCSKDEFESILPKLDFHSLRQEILSSLFLNKNKKSFSFLCLLDRAGYRKPNSNIKINTPSDLDGDYLDNTSDGISD
jgi:hypothetical protein